MRKPHQLQKNHRREMPDLAIYFDSESRVDINTLEHNPYLVVACYCRYSRKREIWRAYSSEELEQFWEDVAVFGGKKKKRVYIYSHNLAYDVIVTGGIPCLCRRGFKVTNWFEKGPVFLITMQNEFGKKLEFVSTTNYFAEPLAKLAKTFGLEKLEYDYVNGSFEEALIYCRRDVEIVKVAVEAFRQIVKEENLGTMARTIAGQAFTSFRHRFMRDRIYIHNNIECLKLEREAYSGGRVECFRLGRFEGNFYTYDVNSMYPFVMRENLMPVRLVSYRKRNKPADLKRMIDAGYLVIAKCLIQVDKPEIGCKLGKNFIFPIGTFWTTICTPEIIYLLERNQILEVAETAVYLGAKIFARYVDYFYQKRQDAKAGGNMVKDKMYKLLLNSLYGKTGQTGEIWERVGDADPEQVGLLEVINEINETIDRIKIFGGSMFKLVREQESYNSFPAIAAHVTAYARMVLLSYIQAAGWENVYYCDTDSLFVNEAGRARLEKYADETRLGAVKLEEQGTNLIIHAPKDYVFGTKIKRKGVKKSSRQISENEFETEIWPHLNYFIKKGRLVGYMNYRQLKKLHRQYNKGWVIENGTVLPLILKADKEKNNWVTAWEDTEYSWEYTLLNLDQPAVVKKAFRRFYLDRIERETEYRKWSAEDSRQFRRVVLSFGGVCDPDYEDLPRWCRRKKGQSLDQLASELASEGYYFENAEELYEALWRYAE